MNYRLNYGTFRNLGTGSSRESPGELLLDLPYLRNQNSRFVLMQYGELLPGLPYLRNLWTTFEAIASGELLPGLPYLRNRLIWIPTFGQVNYYLDYRTSETGRGRGGR